MAKHSSGETSGSTTSGGDRIGKHRPESVWGGGPLGGKSEVRAAQRNSDQGQTFDRSQSDEPNR